MAATQGVVIKRNLFLCSSDLHCNAEFSIVQGRRMWYTAFMPAGMMELVDMRDLGSRAFSVGVRVPMPAPRRSKPYIACSDFLQKSERAHAAAPPFQITTASLGCDLVLDADLKACASKVFTLSSSEIPCLARIPALTARLLSRTGNFFASEPDSLLWIPVRVRYGLGYADLERERPIQIKSSLHGKLLFISARQNFRCRRKPAESVLSAFYRAIDQ